MGIPWRTASLPILCIGSSESAEAPEMAKTTYTYKTTGTLQIQADVYRVPDDEVRPAILWIHGGALIWGSRSWLDPVQVEKYQDAGYTVIAIDHRLAPQVKLDQVIEDLCDAYSWVRHEGPQLFGIDPNRIAVVGHSSGGYLTLMAGFRLPSRPTALVSFYGYGDIAAEWLSRSDPFYSQQPAVSEEEARQAVGQQVVSDAAGWDRTPFYFHTRQRGIWPLEVVGRTPDSAPESFDPLCPIRNVTPTYPPTLLLHGDNDTDVPFEQSALMAAELGRQGVRHELIAMPGLGHVFDAAIDTTAETRGDQLAARVVGLGRCDVEDRSVSGSERREDPPYERLDGHDVLDPLERQHLLHTLSFRQFRRDEDALEIAVIQRFRLDPAHLRRLRPRDSADQWTVGPSLSGLASTLVSAEVNVSTSVANGPATTAPLGISIAIATPRSTGVTIQLSPRSETVRSSASGF